MKCSICETRKPRRHCPGVDGDICSICCGTEREVSIACPLNCPYLQEARTREKVVRLDPKTIPHPDIEITERFLGEHREVTLMAGLSLSQAVAKTSGVVDRDVGDALDSLTRTYRSLANGIVYDSRPVNPYADSVYKAVRARLAEPPAKARDAEILGVLVLYQRMALSYDNGRPKCRAFIGFLRTEFESLASLAPVQRESPRLIEL